MYSFPYFTVNIEEVEAEGKVTRLATSRELAISYSMGPSLNYVRVVLAISSTLPPPV